MKSGIALFISPHLDDVAFSCGGTLIKLAAAGWQTILCTVFTASVLNLEEFALACQTDKGLSADVDYMSLRRAEDAEFARLTNVSEIVHLDFLEAPHRGYESAPELFAGLKPNDEIWREIAIKLGEIVNNFKPNLIFAPSGIGNHVDHLHTIKAILNCDFADRTIWYQDTPYVTRHPDAAPSDLVRQNLQKISVDIGDTLEQKITACVAYRTQIDFQFGGADNLAKTLREFHRDFQEFFLCDLKQNSGNLENKNIKLIG